MTSSESVQEHVAEVGERGYCVLRGRLAPPLVDVLVRHPWAALSDAQRDLLRFPSRSRRARPAIRARPSFTPPAAGANLARTLQRPDDVVPPSPPVLVLDLLHDRLRDRLQHSLGAAYVIERELAGGSTSRVFLAEETRFGRRVVFKVLAPELAAGLRVERFEREIRLAAQLQQANIVPVLAAGDVDGLPWYSMPYVEGASLRERIAGGAVPLAESVAILRDVARALAFAHGHGVVHRDVKPANILLSGGAAVVTDFGLAKALEASQVRAPFDAEISAAGVSMGTPAYMAPEQASGDEVDHRADVYAWGIVAYELLAGRHPFAGKGSSERLIVAQIGEAPPPLHKVAPTVPAPLVALVTRTLAKDPARRPASAGDLLAALDDVAGPGTSGDSWPSRAAVRFQGAGRRRWVVVAGVAAALVAAAGGVAAWRAGRIAEPPLVAVLPFESEGPGADPAFADGLGDAVTSKLARLPGLRVIDRRSVLSVRDAASPQQAGRALGAEYVLRGTVRWARRADGAPRVQVTPLLVRVSDGTTRWAGEAQVVSPADPFTVQATIATEVAVALDVALGRTDRERLARRATSDTAAYAALERGRRISRESGGRTPAEMRLALREYERAYGIDPRYADAFGRAADLVRQIGQGTRTPALYDSATALARRALALDAGQREALNTLSVIELARDRPVAALQVIERAVRENPSSAELLSLLGHMRQQFGDSAGAWNAVARAAPLAPRSPAILSDAFDVALALRRYDDARELLGRRLALDPADLSAIRAGGWLSLAVGDSAGVAAAIREYRARGGVVRAGVSVIHLLRNADAALADELAAGTLDAFGAVTAEDTVSVLGEQARLFLALGDAARARALVDSSYAVAARLAADPTADPERRRHWAREFAWVAAARGDRAAAEGALRSGAASPRIAQSPGSTVDAEQTCMGAETYALLGDAETMLSLLRRCLTMPNGYHLAQLADPVFRRYRADPRFRALGAAGAGRRAAP